MFLKNDVYQLRDEYDDNDENDDIIFVCQIVKHISDVIENNDHNDNLELFISLCVNDNDKLRRNRLIFLYQKLKNYVK